MRSSPWFQPKRSESAPPALRPRDPPTISQKTQDEITDRISRPTESALYRQSLFWKLDSFMDKGFHSWSKMELFEDSKRCMWTPDGAIKPTCKIRPLQTSTGALPPLRSSSKRLNGNGRKFGSFTSRHPRHSLQTPQTGENGTGNGRGESGSVSCRSLAGEKFGYIPTNNKLALANGLAVLGGVNGARFSAQCHPSNRRGTTCQNPAKMNPMAVPTLHRPNFSSTVSGQ